MGDNERLFTMNTRLRLKRSLPQVGLDPRSLDQQPSASLTKLPGFPKQ